MAYSYYQFWRRRRRLAYQESINPPTLSNLVLASPLAGEVTIDVDSDEDNGTLYWYVSTSATPPSSADLKAGTGATQSGNQTVTAVGSQPQITVSALTSTTTYYVSVIHTDEDSNDSNILTDSIVVT